MANTRIEEKGLLLYFSSFEEIKKIDSNELGELIKKEMAWMLGEADEPQFEDVRCDVFHMRLKEIRKIKNKGGDNKSNGGIGDRLNEFSNTFTVEEKQKLGEKAVKRMQTNDASLKDEIVKTVNEHLEMCGHPGDEELFKEIMKKLDEHALKNKPKSHITPWGTEVPY